MLAVQGGAGGGAADGEGQGEGEGEGEGCGFLRGWGRGVCLVCFIDLLFLFLNFKDLTSIINND